MANSLIIQKATEELETQTFGVTEQFLKIHQIVYENDKPKVARVDRENEDGTSIVFFPLKMRNFTWLFMLIQNLKFRFGMSISNPIILFILKHLQKYTILMSFQK